jgi:1,4-dihydroxy-2-naphthoate octaprenyltransferase
VQTGYLTWDVFLVSLPVAFLVAAILYANNMRDIDKDLSNGKRTLANLAGKKGSRREYEFLVGGSFIIIVLLVIFGVAPLATLLALLTLPMAVDLIRTAELYDAPERLNKVVRGTAVLHQRFGWLMIAGVLVAIIVEVV